MSTQILTPQQDRYIKTALATSNTDILDKFGRTTYITETGTSADLTPATHPAGSIVRCTLVPGAITTFTLDTADDTYNVGDEIKFIQTVTGCQVKVIGSDAGGSLGAPLFLGSTAGSAGAGKTRTIRKVSDNGSVADSPLNTSADELLSSITIDVTGGTAAVYTGVPLTTGTGGGAGAIATVSLSSATNIDAIIVTTAGTGYSIGDTLTIGATLLGGTSTLVTIVLVADDLDGVVQAEWDIDLTA